MPPPPNSEQMLNILQKARYLSTLDLSMAYHQIPMAKHCQHITVFVVPGKGLFEWTRMSFGLKEASSTFQRAIQKLITPDMAPFVMVCIDNIGTNAWSLREAQLGLVSQNWIKSVPCCVRLNFDDFSVVSILPILIASAVKVLSRKCIIPS